jgi:3-oxoacyl-[acyl-carrier protein] reductase
MTHELRMGGPRFTGRVALITGASRGIGLAIAQRIVDEGGRVVITARKPEPLAEAVTALGGATVALAVAGKSDDEEHQVDAVEQTLATFGRLDVLVNNTGINPAYGPLLSLDMGAARKTLEVNVVAALSWVRVAHRAWFDRHGGAIVNVASVAGLRPSPGIGFYGVSKAALIRLTTELAVELAPTVRVNAVAPAVVKTRFATALYEGNEAEVLTRYPLGRLGEPSDVAAAVAYLASADAAWVTGQTLVLDGGNTLAGTI